jgi:hypothetical protein
MRERAFALIRQILNADDGREVLADALRGIAGTSGIPPVPFDASVDDYPEVGGPSAAIDAGVPVFVTGRFRSGSTLLWNIFRSIEGCRAYYEPLNERRWFDPTHRGTRVDATHLGVSEYWTEYEGLEHLGAVFHDDWNTRSLHMDEGVWDPDLASYVQGLVDAAAPRRPVLQFNRVDFRLPWLRHWFPNAVVVHLFRHPRDQWCSSLVDISAFPKDGRLTDFAHHDHFYLLAWVRDLRYRFPVLDETQVRHPYELFYLIWKLSWLFGRHYAHYSIGIERLTADPARELRRLLDAVGMPHVETAPLLKLIVAQPQGKWRAYADNDWFAERETRCETLLRQWAGVPVGPPAREATTPPAKAT